MTGCIDRKTGKVTIMRDGVTQEQINAVIRRLLSAANAVVGEKSGA
jgi:hypothetical protein